MEKKTYMKPETETIHTESCQLLAGTNHDSIKKADGQNDLEADKDGYYWAE